MIYYRKGLGLLKFELIGLIMVWATVQVNLSELNAGFVSVSGAFEKRIYITGACQNVVLKTNPD